MPETPGILIDEALFEVRGGNQLWVRGIPDYEDPSDGWGNNLYQFVLRYTAPDRTHHDRWHEVEILDLGFERPGGVDGLFDNIDTFRFSHHDIPHNDQPDDQLVRFLIRGQAWRMPEEGPLMLTWSLVMPEDEPQSMLTAENIGFFREDLEAAFDQFESASNLLFVEVAHSDSQTGDILLTYGPKSVSENENGQTVFNLGYARFPSDDPVIVIRDITGIAGETYTEDKPWRFTTMVHEIGHALGLDHPFSDGNAGTTWPALDDSLRNSDATIMSYLRPSERTTQGLYEADISALQFLYGAPDTAFDGVESLIKTPIDYV